MMIAAARTAKTDSMLIKREATGAETYFWPRTWNVYATPQLIIPEYKIGIAAFLIEEH